VKTKLDKQSGIAQARRALHDISPRYSSPHSSPSRKERVEFRVHLRLFPCAICHRGDKSGDKEAGCRATELSADISGSLS